MRETEVGLIRDQIVKGLLRTLLVVKLEPLVKALAQLVSVVKNTIDKDIDIWCSTINVL